MSFNQSLNLVPSQTQRSSDGQKHLHNFRNTFIEEKDLQKPSKFEAEQIAQRTQKAIGGQLAQKAATTLSQHAQQLKQEEAKHILYTAQGQASINHVGVQPQKRIIQMHHTQKDPLAPSGFRHKKVAPGAGSPPPTILHSPPRKLTVEDQLNWKIPPCISNWKNQKGYVIPLEMRLKADGRNLNQTTINERHSLVTNALYIAERESRKELEERNKITQSLQYQEYLKKEEELRINAVKAREEKNRMLQEQAEQTENLKRKNDPEAIQRIEEKEERDNIRYLQKREIERTQRLEAAGQKKAKEVRDKERDISEKVALGQAQPTQSREVQFDQRLFNRTSGVEAGFGSDDENHLYDKPLFGDRTKNTIYQQNLNKDEEDEENEKGIASLVKNPKRAFEGTENKRGNSNKPVEFEKHVDPAFQKENITKKRIVDDYSD